MAETKTKPTKADVAAFLDAVEPAQRREDAKAVCAMMTRITGEPPTMWGPTMIGFGSYHYRYDSGHEGDAMRIGFSPRKAALTLYLMGSYAAGDVDKSEALLAKLGKHSTGKSCLYIKKLADVDMAVLEELAKESLAWMDQKYPR